MCKNILVEVSRCAKYFGRVDTYKWRCQGCARRCWSSRYIEMEVSRVSRNILRSSGHVKMEL